MRWRVTIGAVILAATGCVSQTRVPAQTVDPAVVASAVTAELDRRAAAGYSIAAAIGTANINAASGDISHAHPTDRDRRRDPWSDARATTSDDGWNDSRRCARTGAGRHECSVVADRLAVPGHLFAPNATGLVLSGFTRYGATVVDAVSGAPVVGACVYTGLPAGCPTGADQTDSSGYFAVDLPTGSSFAFTVEHPSYNTIIQATIASGAVNVLRMSKANAPGASPTSSPVGSAIPPGTPPPQALGSERFFFKVVDSATRTPLQNVCVIYGVYTSCLFTNSDGLYWLDVPPNGSRWSFYFSRSDYWPTEIIEQYVPGMGSVPTTVYLRHR